MIRAALMKQVFDAISSHRYLMLDDFVIEEYTSTNEQTCLRARYRYDENWRFLFSIPDSKTTRAGDTNYIFSCTMRPGRESIEETIQARERSGLLKEIREWTERLHDDVVSAPIVRQFAEQNSAIEELFEKVTALPEEPLSANDAKEFREALDKAKAELTEQLQKEIADKEVLRQKVTELGQDVEFLKNTLETMTKRTWGEVLLVRLNKWRQRFSLRQLATGTRIFQKLLPPEVAEDFEPIADAVDYVADAVGESTPDIASQNYEETESEATRPR